MSKPAGETWIITITPLADGVPTEARIRRLLKTALRRDRLRCTALREPDEIRRLKGIIEGMTSRAASGKPVTWIDRRRIIIRRRRRQKIPDDSAAITVGDPLVQSSAFVEGVNKAKRRKPLQGFQPLLENDGTTQDETALFKGAQNAEHESVNLLGKPGNGVWWNKISWHRMFSQHIQWRRFTPRQRRQGANSFRILITSSAATKSVAVALADLPDVATQQTELLPQESDSITQPTGSVL
jgi:hypothetical protein